jgi:hypothetical protein|tara:strand:- start:904 stop:2073 length:1170 start_codon:yes stop_codon:yes gene_type:complete
MSKLFDDVLINIQRNKKSLEDGKPNCIPFEWFPKLRKVIPGIIRGTNWIVTAGSGVGKTQFSKHNFVFKPIEWVKNNPNTGIKLKILYFALEESKEEFMNTLISNKLYADYQLEIDVMSLQSMGDTPITDDIIEKIKKCKDYFNDLEEYLEIVDTISNPTGIYKYVRDYSIQNGVHYYYNFKNDKQKYNPITYNAYAALKAKGESSDYAYCHYIPNDPNEYVEVIVDHFSLLQPEKGAETTHAAMSLMSAEYGRKNITKHWNYVFINVQQQSAEGEKAEYTKMGGKIEEKFKPTLASLGDNKLTQRDAHVVLGLFGPARHNIHSFNGYNISKLQDNFRSLEVLKNRIGSGFVEDSLYFDGAVNEFRELPDEMTENNYQYIIQKRNNKFK